MSPVGSSNPLIIETRRKARVNSAPREKNSYVKGLEAKRNSFGDNGDRSRQAWQPRHLSRAGAERDVPFRHGTETARLNTAFVAQLLGQAMRDSAKSSSGVLAAYQQATAPAPVCDRRL